MSTATAGQFSNPGRIRRGLKSIPALGCSLSVREQESSDFGGVSPSDEMREVAEEFHTKVRGGNSLASAGDSRVDLTLCFA